MAGKVYVNGQVVTKAGTPVPGDADITIQSDLPYVSRGGIKLVAALDSFGINPANDICADVGSSTGGFTDVLLQRRATRVYAIDVGYGQLAWKLRQDDRVTVMERTNARYLETLPEQVDLVTVDTSFISLKHILPAVTAWLVVPARVIALVKPQFEAGRAQVPRGGVVRDRRIHHQVLEQVAAYARQADLMLLGLIASPITGPAGNHEFFLHLGWQTSQPPVDLTAAIKSCLDTLPPLS
jgi:23S rRNA (cytidine1920-2'-O)/16S rRNA (cytidine1409-2'-O)-methyltransferase